MHLHRNVGTCPVSPPEFAAQTGVDGFDDGVFDLKPERARRIVATSEVNIRRLSISSYTRH